VLIAIAESAVSTSMELLDNCQVPKLSGTIGSWDRSFGSTRRCRCDACCRLWRTKWSWQLRRKAWVAKKYPYHY